MLRSIRYAAFFLIVAGVLALPGLVIGAAGGPGAGVGPGGGTPQHDHSSDAEGGTLDFTNNVHDHSSTAEGGSLGNVTVTGNESLQGELNLDRTGGGIIDSTDNGQPLLLRGNDAGGTLRTLVQCDGDIGCILAYNGSTRLTTVSGGVDVTGALSATGDISTGASQTIQVGSVFTGGGIYLADGQLDVSDSAGFPEIAWRNNGSTIAQQRFNGSEFRIQSLTDGAPFTIYTDTAGGSATPMMQLDADATSSVLLMNRTMPWVASFYGTGGSGSSCGDVRSINVTSCSRSSTGKYQLDFNQPSAPAASSNPICSCSVTSIVSTTASCKVGASTGYNAFDIVTSQGGSFADVGFMVTCQGI